MNPQKLMPINMPIATPRNQSEFYTTLRRYTQRLKQQRDISLGYLSRINQLEAQLRIKDSQIDRLNRANRQLSDKLSLYTSVLERSQPKRSMRMSMILGNMTESIIQTKQQVDYLQMPKPFEQFFVANLMDVQKGVVSFRFKFDPYNNQQQIVSNLLINNSSALWQCQPANLNSPERPPQFMLFITNSPNTIKTHKQIHFELIELLNPSYYYFVTCMVQRQLVSINGKLFWAPVAYGFITLIPFPDVYFRLLQEIGIQIKTKNQLDQKKLFDSLNQLMKSPTTFQVQTRYLFLGKLHLWKIPDVHNIDAHALTFSLGVIQKFALQLIIDVLIIFLLEIPITLISQDELLLCQFMFYFVYIIKPLKYPYPIVFNVNQKLRDLLQSPFPTFTGCTNAKIVQPFLNERAVFDLDKKIAKSWPLLGHLDSSRQFLMKTASRVGNYTRFNIVTQQIIKGHQYRELEPYWKDFSKTQLYQNYIHKS